MENFSIASEISLWDKVTAYIKQLPDLANDRPYCAGQKVLNVATVQVIKQAKASGWSQVPDQVTEPGTIEPPCFLPPVNKEKARNMPVEEEPASLALSIADTSRFREGWITVRFRNEGSQPVRIPDKINNKTADFFFITKLKTERGDVRILNAEMGTMTFRQPLDYRELAPARNTASRFRCAWMKSSWKTGNNVLVNSKRTIIISRVRIVFWGLSGQYPNLYGNEKNLPVFRNFGLPVPPCCGMGGHG